MKIGLINKGNREERFGKYVAGPGKEQKKHVNKCS
jgi:hypothetical protein